MLPVFTPNFTSKVGNDSAYLPYKIFSIHNKQNVRPKNRPFPLVSLIKIPRSKAHLIRFLGLTDLDVICSKKVLPSNVIVDQIIFSFN